MVSPRGDHWMGGLQVPRELLGGVWMMTFSSVFVLEW